MRFLRSRAHSGDLPELLNRCKPDGSKILYSAHTIREFHDLFIAVLITYAVLHQNMFATAEALSPDREDFDETKIDPNLCQRLEEDASHATNVAQLLRAILNSRALAFHLNFLADEDALELPNRMSGFDMVFASQNRMGPVPLRPDRKRAKQRRLDLKVRKSSRNSSRNEQPDARTIDRKDLGVVDERPPEEHGCLGEAEDKDVVGRKDSGGHESNDLCEADSECVCEDSGEGQGSAECNEVNLEQQTFRDLWVVEIPH